MLISRASKTALISIAILFCQPGFAQNLLSPRPVVSPQPPQPTNAAGQAVEGWVTVRYTVGANGVPADVYVIDAMPPGIDTGPTLETFADWKFTPGTSAGSAINWYNNQTRIVFRTEGGSSPTADAFATGYAQIGELLESGDARAALSASETLIADNASRLSELGLALVQNAVIQTELDAPFAALAALRMATDPHVPMLGGAELYGAVKLRLELEQQLSHTQEAIRSYRRLEKAIGNQDADLDQQGKTLIQLWDLAPLLEVYGRIDGGRWQFDAGRRFFYLDKIEGGSLSTIDAECDTRKLTLEFDPNVDYQLPESFGACTLVLHGDNGTRFSLVEALPPE
jgi:hypothetical protein